MAFADQLRIRARAADQALLLFVIGEPVSGKSTVVSNLLKYLTAKEPALLIKLIRWGDAMRAERHLGLLAADRLPGDLSAEEFAGLSAFVGEQVQAARAAIQGAGLVVAEFPGCTAVMGKSGIDGLDRGFSTCRTFVADPGAHYLALSAEPRLRELFMSSRETAPADATNARSATPLAANRVHEQVTALMQRLHASGRMAPPGQLAAFASDPVLRERIHFQRFLPHLLAQEIGAPTDRCLVARNVLVPPELQPAAQADTAFLDGLDWIRERYSI
ncbi:MAG: hypothetical protein JO247_10630 [Chloroflexi bacterium]|nr:hypothetical protein [Chloroflexota bacterium]